MFSLLLIGLLFGLTLAQYPPKSPRKLRSIKSPVDRNITISYKSPPLGTCRSAYDWQKQYTGWVHIPGEYPTNTFFWFVEAREPSDQLTIWLNGGPGTSSMLGMFTENGPCEVIAEAEGVFGTKYREWGWDRVSHMLYIDQPNQVGFSYDTPTNCSLDLSTSNLYTPAQTLPDNQQAFTFLNGTFSSLNPDHTANTTDISAMAIWHMLQGFLTTFPQYTPSSNNSSSIVSVNLFAESYGGKYAPAFASLWNDQNEKIKNGTLSVAGALEIKLGSVGIINGCVDNLIQGPYYPQMANNNTYDFKAINPNRAAMAAASFNQSGGCADRITQCRTAKKALDVDGNGDNTQVNELCNKAHMVCSEQVVDPYLDARRSVYDIAHTLPDSFPSSLYLEYLNTAEFLNAIGSPVNYTETNQVIVNEFVSTGDYERDALIPEIAALLAIGIRVAFIYGDRDYICNWMGGEAISLAVAAEPPGGVAPSVYAVQFPQAGYAPIIVNNSYVGGEVRQFANLSFSRIYDAGHLVPAYQPETAFQVFARVIKGTSLSTGDIVEASYATNGTQFSDRKAKLPPSPPNTCYIRNIPSSCTSDQISAIEAGEGVTMGGIWYSRQEDYVPPSSQSSISPSINVGQVTTTVKDGGGTRTVVESVTVTETEVKTGLYTATGTPVPTDAAIAFKAPVALMFGAVLIAFRGWI